MELGRVPRSSPAVEIAGLAAVVLLAWLLPRADAEPVLISAFDQPLLFVYGEWQGKVAVREGCLPIRGVNGKGGGGCVAVRDLTPHAERLPALRLRVGAANQAKGIALLLVDQA